MRMSEVLRHLRQQQAASGARPRLIQRYAAFLPVTSATPPITLGEGNTPLVHARALGRAIGIPELHLKVEGMNPTGSFKDRGMVVAVARAMEDGAEAVLCASTGNTAASATAYAAAAGLESIVILPAGRIARGKLVQALFGGAKVVAVDGGFDDALRIVRELSGEPGKAGSAEGAGGTADRAPGTEGATPAGGSPNGTPKRRVTLVNSVNPHRIAGQQTAAFEVIDDLGGAPDYVALPVGNAGNITAYWKAFNAYRDAGLVETRPVMLGFQAAGAAPLVAGHPIAEPETVATAIRIGDPASWHGAIRARDESGGRIEAVSDDEILQAWRDLARLEGVFCEPASAAPVAGLRKLVAERAIDPGGTVVAVLTGHGLKDPELAARHGPEIQTAEATVEGVRQALGW
jgi:threonine synthase